MRHVSASLGAQYTVTKYLGRISMGNAERITAAREFILARCPAVVIAHLGPEGQLFDSSCPWQVVVVYVSAAGRRESHRRRTGGFDLFLREPKERADWAAIVSLALDEAECMSVVRCQQNFVLDESCPAVILPAVSLLAQGHLAVLMHPSAGGHPTEEEEVRIGTVLGLSPSELPEIPDVRDLAGWVARSEGVEARVGRSEDYWQPLRDENGPGSGSLVKKAKREWDSLSPGADWKRVEDLLEVALGEAAISFDVVLNALEQLQMRLEGTK
jgi:hypothetical protein